MADLCGGFVTRLGPADREPASTSARRVIEAQIRRAVREALSAVREET